MLNKKALAGTAGAPKEYVEDVFSTYLYTGNASTQTITNNIDISGKGGLVWTKSRSNATGHLLFDTERGLGTSGNRPDLHTELTSAQIISGEGISSFNSNGYTLENAVSSNGSGRTFVSWTFRKAKKFFDVVTYTGNGTARTISHNLGSTPGWIIVKRTDAAAGWPVYHRSIGATKALELQITNAAFDSSSYWNNTEPTSTVFTVGTDSYVNANGGTYVAYLFAHDAGGFGDAGSDSIISCGSFSGSVSVNLGWEAQWVLIKDAGAAGQWYLFDNMRGMAETDGRSLSPNTSGAESNVGAFIVPTATGFKNVGGGNYIYIAIRRGPMKTPTVGTQIYYPLTRNGTGATATVTGVGFPPDLYIGQQRPASNNCFWSDKLRGSSRGLKSTNASTETTSGSTTDVMSHDQNGVTLGTGSNANINPGSGNSVINHFFRRAPGFFDVVCYTGTDTISQAISHNLGVAPELMIVKRRNGAQDWYVYSATTGNTRSLFLNLTYEQASPSTGYWQNTSPTSTQFTVGSQINVGNTYVAYLFASVSGVSKVGSYTGNGSSVTVTTGFQPRFVMVKRYDSTGDWIYSDSARGLVAGSDPYLLLNLDTPEDSDEDWVDISSTGFTVNQTSSANANVNTGTYIYLAIA